MRDLIMVAVATLFVANTALAGVASCESAASGKKLSGAARNSFMKKCEKDAATDACEAKALSKAGKPLAGAAKAASVKKCLAEAGK